jgi:D-alanyl-D-alanine carboxypeptidase
MDSGRLLWGKKPDQEMRPASTTKIMTALILLENTAPDDKITAPSDVGQITGSSLYMKPNEVVNARDLLYALLLRSANDGAYSIAKHVAGSVEDFAELMNSRAEQIGCLHTHFENPHGLDDDGHVSTARDLGLIAREAMRNEDFRKAAGEERRWIQRSINQEDLLLISKNRFVKNDETATGIKTGYTDNAGQCFVGSSEEDGLRIITVVLKSQDWLGDTQKLNSWALKIHQAQELIKKGTAVGDVPVAGGVDESLSVVAAEDMSTAVSSKGIDIPKPRVEPLPDLAAPITAGQTVGSLVFEFADGSEVRSAALAAADLAVKPERKLPVGTPIGLALLAALAGGSQLLRLRSRKIGRIYRP